MGEWAAIIGLGHDPEQKSGARSRLEQMNANFKKVKWELFPVFQKLRTLSYVEYFLVGCGVACPASSQGQIPKWLGPGRGEHHTHRRMREAAGLRSH